MVRIAPNEIAVADSAAVKEVHRIGSGFNKAPWYGKFVGEVEKGHGRGIFSMQDPKLHADRRRLFSSGFAKQALRDWEDVLQDKTALTIARIKQSLRETGKADILAWFTYMANDIISTISFGESMKSLEIGQKTQFVLDLETTMKWSGRCVELPWIAPISRAMSPRARLNAKGFQMIKRTRELEAAGNGFRGTIFSKMIDKDTAGALAPDQVGREAANLIIAGSDTTAVTSTYLIYAILRHPDVERKVIEELQTLPASYTSDDLQALPYLKTVIQEALRLYGAAPGSLPRAVPAEGRMLASYFIPQGTVVATHAYTLHRDPDIFENPYEFRPDRWIEPTRAMKDAYMPWGGGSRVCLGLHLAMYELALVATRFFSDLSNVTLAEETDDISMEFENHFLIAPKSHRCVIRTS